MKLGFRNIKISLYDASESSLLKCLDYLFYEFASVLIKILISEQFQSNESEWYLYFSKNSYNLSHSFMLGTSNVNIEVGGKLPNLFML